MSTRLPSPTAPRPSKRELLASRIAARVKVQFDVDLRDVVLNPAQGAWRTNSALDVMRWEGSAKWHAPSFTFPLRVSVCSWDTMTSCLKFGFVVTRDGPCGYEVHSLEP